MKPIVDKDPGDEKPERCPCSNKTCSCKPKPIPKLPPREHGDECDCIACFNSSMSKWNRPLR